MKQLTSKTLQVKSKTLMTFENNRIDKSNAFASTTETLVPPPTTVIVFSKKQPTI